MKFKVWFVDKQDKKHWFEIVEANNESEARNKFNYDEKWVRITSISLV